MTTLDNNPGGGGGNDQGPGATLVGSRLSDVARSVHDPARDLKLPVLSLKDWDVLKNDRKAIAAVIAAQGFYEAEYVMDHDDGRCAAKQKAPARDALDRLRRAFADVAPEDILQRATRLGDDVDALPGGDRKGDGRGALVQSAQVFLALRDRFRDLRPENNRPLDLRAPWFEVRDQKDAAGCVGWALADLLWRQSEGRLDVPSARFIWQGAKEMDGEKRPTTMIAGAGTSLRAALRLVKTFGYALESEISSDDDAPFRGSIDGFYKTLRPRRIHNFLNFGNDVKTRVAWLSLGRPLVCSLRAGQNFISATGRDAVAEGDDPGSPHLFGHCVTVMGYRVGHRDGASFVADSRPLPKLVEEIEERDRTRLKEGRPDDRRHEDFPIQYLIRNSAGGDWGDRGYAWMNHADFRRQVRETYGVFWRRADFETVVGGYGRGESTSRAR
ncbi:MAG TPA: hypothetical protein VGG33_19165 [Polyangia bacterium]